jgi:hypothetical protein
MSYLSFETKFTKRNIFHNVVTLGIIRCADVSYDFVYITDRTKYF